jgi:hypothetical protein
VERARVKEMEDEIRRLRMENEFLKKQRPSSRGRSRSRAMRCDRRGKGQHGRAAVDDDLGAALQEPSRGAEPGPTRPTGDNYGLVGSVCSGDSRLQVIHGFSSVIAPGTRRWRGS